MVSARLAVGRLHDNRVSLVPIAPDGSPGEPAELVDLSAVAGDIHEMRFDSRRRLLYVTHTYLDGWYAQHSGYGRHISVVDVDRAEFHAVWDLSGHGRTVHGAHDLWIDSGRDCLWACVEQSADVSGGLVRLDLDSGAVLAHIPAEARAAHWFCVTADGARAVTANKEAPFVSVLDLDAEQFVGRIEVPGSEGIAAGPGDRVFVAGPCRLPGAPVAPPGVRVIDTATLQVEALLPMRFAPGAVHVTQTGALLVAELRTATGQGRPVQGRLHIYDAQTLTRTGDAPIGAAVLTITSSDDGRLAFVADSWGGLVTVVNLDTGLVVDTISSQPGAHGLAWITAHDLA